jgi:hypothetical protein
MGEGPPHAQTGQQDQRLPGVGGLDLSKSEWSLVSRSDAWQARNAG